MTPIQAWGRAAGPRLHSRMCAAVTAGSCLLHLWLVAGNHHALWLNLSMLAMVAVCLPCSVHIWRHVRVGTLHRVMASALAMALLHAVLLLAAGPASHSHGTAAAVGAAGIAGTEAFAETAAAPSASLGVIALEITTALLAATLVARLRRGQVACV
ncbi:hypothetical protein SRABI83_02746 [Arthrobacter sp. Bi83]|uniref:hypothetical protein n=1 Tax=Arthrobacter sp. Bi83 TaxID=2822353 RepID=UPI001D6CD7D4|nr:hypothetical protein [Arthrobacter sp. Bi83]CAH0235816.1 hypothetical protein SRABI83_02746 [Arthrobacter sp. Bi83]